MIARALLTVSMLVAVAACGGEPAGGGDGVEVVVTTSVLADVVAEVVGDGGSVEALMEPGTDPHDFALSPGQAARLRSADLVVANGLGLEAGLEEALDSAAAEGTVVLSLAEQVDPIPFGEHGGEHDEEAEHDEESEHDGESHEHEGDDPHFTLDPLRMADAMDLVAEALVELDPDGPWRENAAGTRTELEDLHEEIRDTLSSIPSDRRKLVTNHDALGYFAERYDFEVVGTVIPGGSTLAEPSAADLAELAETLRSEGVSAIFADTTGSVDLAETVAAEVGRPVEVHSLYTGSLGPEGSGAGSYVGMMRTNASIIASGLDG
ncbi:MAG: metal ABC transporter solute-binding protein, Zn/Mn family [Actinomycetota bacterium]